MVKYKVGGVTSISGLTFVGQKAKVTIRNKDGAFVIKTFSKRSESFIERTPFLRGFVKLYNAFKMVTGTIIGKIALGLFIFSFIMAALSFIFEGVPSGESVMSLMDMILAVTSLVMLLGMIIYTGLIRNLHGLEHRFIGAYNSGEPLTVENVKKQRKETPQCGGTLLGIIVMIDIIWIYLLALPSPLIWLLIPSLGYEGFLIAKGTKWYSKVLYFPGYIIQKFTTGYKVSDETIARYLEGFKAFVMQEDRLK